MFVATDSAKSTSSASAPGVHPEDMFRVSGPVLVIDDDPDLLSLLSTALHMAGYSTAAATDGFEALRQLYEARPALVTLDLMMPGIDGHETLRQIRQFSNVPVIVVSALAGLREVMRALDSGAADFLAKPFHPAELVSRVHAILRRSEPATLVNAAVFPRAGLTVNPEARRLARHGQEIRLSPKEFELLWLLVKRAGNPVSYETICKEVWGEDTVQARDRAKWVVFLLRRKIEDDPAQPQILLNRPGYGYEFRAA